MTVNYHVRNFSVNKMNTIYGPEMLGCNFFFFLKLPTILIRVP
jgi:hypothetical protein